MGTGCQGFLAAPSPALGMAAFLENGLDAGWGRSHPGNLRSFILYCHLSVDLSFPTGTPLKMHIERIPRPLGRAERATIKTRIPYISVLPAAFCGELPWATQKGCFRQNFVD